VSAASSNPDEKLPTNDNRKGAQLWPAWVYCTRYSDRPSSGESLLLKPVYTVFRSVTWQVMDYSSHSNMGNIWIFCKRTGPPLADSGL
jgi:hypothetical protein